VLIELKQFDTKVWIQYLVMIQHN